MKKSFKKIILISLGVGLLSFFLVFTWGMYSIYSSVSKSCLEAKSKYGGDCVEGMIGVLTDSNTSIEEKNHAVWVLGQLADERARPILETMHIDALLPDKEPLNKVISQYEINKAIKWIKEGNITSWMYKNIR